MLSGAEVLRTADYSAGRKTGIGVEASIDHAEHPGGLARRGLILPKLPTQSGNSARRVLVFKPSPILKRRVSLRQPRASGAGQDGVK